MEPRGEQLEWLCGDVLRECLGSHSTSIISEFDRTLSADDREYLVQCVFWRAVIAKEWWLAEECLMHGMSLVPRDGCVDSPLHLAMQYCGDATDTISWLLDHGADIERRDWSLGNATPLIYAALIGCHEVVELLLNRGANINAGTEIDDDDTALIVAAKAGDEKLARLLLSHGANLDRKNRWGQDASTAARSHGHIQLAQLLAREGQR